MGILDLQPNETKVVGNMGTYYLWLASEVGEKQSYGTRFLAHGLWHSLQKDGARLEMDCKTPSWCHRELLGMEKLSHTFGNQECETQREEIDGREELGFSLGRREETKFLLYVRWYSQVLDIGHGNVFWGITIQFTMSRELGQVAEIAKGLKERVG